MEKKLLDAEWMILRALWDCPPQTMGQIIASMQREHPEIAWQYKTYHSYLRIMLEKGLIRCEDKNLRDKLYSPAITREDALRQESDTLLARISAKSMGALAFALAQNASLSPRDRKALQEMAARMEQSEGGQDYGK